jgi:hypothetical protein
MADAHYRPPRREKVYIELHAAEAASILSQPQLLQAMTNGELNGIAVAVNKELSTRGTNDVGTEPTNDARLYSDHSHNGRTE